MKQGTSHRRFRFKPSVLRRAQGILTTLLLLVGAGCAAVVIWNYYLTGPWTRDGQVQGYVVDLAPEVSGRVVRLNVVDNQAVKRGDVLYEIEPLDFQLAVASAEAELQSRQADMQAKLEQAARRKALTTDSTSVEERQTFASSAEQARAAFGTAVTQLNQARVNLVRTKVLSPVNGKVTNLQLQEGDYATKGTVNLSLLNTDNIWITGFFEETKLAGVKVGESASAMLMGYPEPVLGHVESIAQGISTPNTNPDARGLASVSPVFTWVRLAQRIPVRIHIDEVPAGVHLAVGMTATVSMGRDARPGTTHGLLSRLLTQ